MRLRRRREEAFLLMDALAALTVFGAGILLAMTFLRTEVRETRFAHERASAQFIAESEIERLATVPWEALVVGEKQPLELAEPAAAGLKNGFGQLTVREIAPGLKEASVRIEWETPKRHNLCATLTRRFAKEVRP